LQFGYDLLNELTNANAVALAYDAEQRITNTISSGLGFGAGYDADGRLTQVTYAGLFSVAYAYDSRDRLTSVSDTLTGTQLQFNYDDAGRLTNVVRPNGVHSLISYDAAGRITRVREGAFVDLQYTLSGAGDVASMDVTAPLNPANVTPLAASSFDFDAAQQIRTSGYAYDLRGRMTQSPGVIYSYDDVSRLVAISGTNLSYNGLGDVVTRSSATFTNLLFYNYALGLGPLVAEKDGVSGQFVRFYVWSPGGRLLYLIQAANNSVRFYHFDRMGSTLALTDGAGSVSDAFAYTPFGQQLARTGTNDQPFTYIGRFGVRREGALYQMRARYYDPRLGCFLTRDAHAPDPAEPLTLNPYQYSLANPYRYVDPEGMDRSVYFAGHAWIEVDVYDAQGRVKGRVVLNFAPEYLWNPGQPDFRVMSTRDVFYPRAIRYNIKSSREDDEWLVREWKRLAYDKDTSNWNALNNCVWKTLQYAGATEDTSAQDEAARKSAEKYLRNRPPQGESGPVMYAAPPDPWYKRFGNWVSEKAETAENTLNWILNGFKN